jgi:hypothetical protein
VSVREQLRRLQEHPEFLERLKASSEAQVLYSQLVELQQSNPLLLFEPHPPGRDGRRPQLEFIQARTPVVAAFAGNRFGKSTVLGVCGLREALPRDVLPPLLQESKRFEGPTAGWIMVPTEDKIDDSFRPVFQKWCPPREFKGGSWGKAFNGGTNTLSFECGSTIRSRRTSRTRRLWVARGCIGLGMTSLLLRSIRRRGCGVSGTTAATRCSR